MGESLDDPSGLMNIGLHWGGALYMGQLVPGGRLDVTALGDEVNECARIQDSARGATILASKALLEQLTEDDAAGVGLDPEKIVYQPLSDWPTVTEKARRDAGGVAVTEL
jgi:class 3 adenylate cyclase